MQCISWFLKLSLNCFSNRSVSSFLHCKILLLIKKYDFPYSRKIFSNYLLIASSFHLHSVKRFLHKNLEGLKQTSNFFFLHKLHLHFTTQKLCVVFFIDDWTHSTAILRLLTKNGHKQHKVHCDFQGKWGKNLFCRLNQTILQAITLHWFDFATYIL